MMTIDSLFLPDDEKEWLSKLGIDFMHKIGINQGQRVLDFGCRVGNYSLPAANVVGPTGIVFALDMNHQAIDDMNNRATTLGIENIEPIKTDGELVVLLPDESVDVIFLYDVIHGLICVDDTLGSYERLLDEFYRVLRQNGMFSLFIKHIDETGFTSEDILATTKSHFAYEREMEMRLMHWNHQENGIIHTFRKTK